MCRSLLLVFNKSRGKKKKEQSRKLPEEGRNSFVAFMSQKESFSNSYVIKKIPKKILEKYTKLLSLGITRAV